MTREPSGTSANAYRAAFRRPETLPGKGGSIAVVVLEPEHVKTDIPLVLVPGWAATAAVHQRNAILFAEAGRRTMVISAPHGIPAASRQYGDLPTAEARKAAAVDDALARKLVSRVDIVTHSEAAIFVTACARKRPELYRSITYVAPAGLIGEDSFWRLAWRFALDGARQRSLSGKEEGRWSQALIALREAGKSLVSAPLRSLAEVLAIAHAQIQDDLRVLHDRGVKIFIVHPAGDLVFPMARMNPDVWERDANGKPRSKKKNVPIVVDSTMVNGFVSAGDRSGKGAVSDSHNAWYLSPERYTSAVDALLDTLE